MTAKFREAAHLSGTGTLMPCRIGKVHQTPAEFNDLALKILASSIRLASNLHLSAY